MIEKILATDANVTLTVARLTLGLVMLPHGAQKLLGWYGGYGFSNTVQFFSSIGLHPILGTLIILAESFGALGLIFGGLTRLSAFGIAVTMLGAAIYQRQHGFFMNWFGTQAGEGFEYHLLAIGLGAMLVIGGGGAWSVDGWLTQRN